MNDTIYDHYIAIGWSIKNMAELFHDGGETYWTVFLEYDPLVDS